MRSWKRTGGVAAAVAVSLAAAGCGDYSGPLSTAELISKGDEICDQGQQRFSEIQAQPPASASEAEDQTNALIRVSRDELDELEGLEPPEDLKGRYDRYLDSREAAIEELEKGRDAAERHDRVAYGAAQDRSIEAAAKREKLARAVGFEVCGVGRD